MQYEKEELTPLISAWDMLDHRPRSFELYEEYSRQSIDDTIRTRKEIFDKADAKTRDELLKNIEREIGNFCAWLTEIKNFEPATAHYCSVSLKSLLLGLPNGVQVAQLFDTILDTLIEK
jgi:hypothetical protein